MAANDMSMAKWWAMAKGERPPAVADKGLTDAEQSARFKEAAEGAGVNFDEGKLKAALRGIAKPDKKTEKKD